MNRIQKRINIVIIFLVLFSLIGLVVYFIIKPNPSCFDKIRNQGEEKADCGGPCRPCAEVIELKNLEIEKVEWVKNKQGFYDVSVRVKNSNQLYGAAEFSLGIYQAREGKEAASWQKSFILPGETKSVLIYNYEKEESLAENEMEVIINQDRTAWKKFSNYNSPRLLIHDSRYEAKGGGEVGFGQTSGTLINKSDVDLETITVKVFLRDGTGKLLAIGQQTMNTVRAGEKREYMIGFSRKISGSIEKIETEAETNIFDSENYIQTHGRPEKWDTKE